MATVYREETADRFGVRRLRKRRRRGAWAPDPSAARLGFRTGFGTVNAWAGSPSGVFQRCLHDRCQRADQCVCVVEGRNAAEGQPQRIRACPRVDVQVIERLDVVG